MGKLIQIIVVLAGIVAIYGYATDQDINEMFSFIVDNIQPILETLKEIIVTTFDTTKDIVQDKINNK